MTKIEQAGRLAARLFEAKSTELLRYLRQRLHSDADARDIAQEAYLRFIRLADPDRMEKPDAYLFRIATNLLWEHRLRERGLSGQTPLDESPTVEHSPVDLTLSGQVAQRVRLALDGLSPQQRAVLILHLRDGLTHAQVADQIGISVSMVKKHLNAALAFCRRRLRDVAG